MKSKKNIREKAISIMGFAKHYIQLVSKCVDYAAILKLKYYNCYQCETSQPMLKTNKGKTCCVCGTVKTKNNLTNF
jgi:hypothetical protein